VTPGEVTRILGERIAAGEYSIGEQLPTLEELQDAFFAGKSTAVARVAYAPLIDCGMVQVRQGRYGGHFVVSTQPIPKSPNEFAGISGHLAGLVSALVQVTDRTFYGVEFQDTVSGEKFGRSFHTTVIGACEFSSTILMALGEKQGYADKAASAAAFNLPAPDDSDGKYTVRIYEQQLFERS
jgi:DNA-binding transcriptional regulator YhcF (GntR family)